MARVKPTEQKTNNGANVGYDADFSQVHSDWGGERLRDDSARRWSFTAVCQELID